MKTPVTPVAVRIPALLIVITFLAACASSQTSSTTPYLEGSYLDRVQTLERDDIRVSAAVPSADETRDIFSQNLYRQGIQPVWLRIENKKETAVNFLPVGLDPAYYSPLEAANISLKPGKQVKPQSLVNHFFLEQNINLIVPAGEQLNGFIFTQLDEGTKSFNVDISYEGAFESFTFFIPVPGLNIDHYEIDWKDLYPQEQVKEFDETELIETLEKLPCCVSNSDGSDTGDPLNLVIIGDLLDVYVAFMRAGWDETESVTSASAWKTFRSFVSGGEYRYSPVSNLYVFERPQDVAFQKARDNIHERNHLRLWMSPARFQGYPVWIGQISRDIGVRFTKKTITTHKIDPDVDETREYLLENLAYSQAVSKVGYVRGVGEVPQDSPKGNLTGDPWFTDGYRLVLWLTTEPTPLSELRALHWRNPHDD
jgi:hypothetical protein